MQPFSGTQTVQQWLEDFLDAANHEQPLVLAENVRAILDSVHERLGAEWEWTWVSLLVALFGIERWFISQRSVANVSTGPPSFRGSESWCVVRPAVSISSLMSCR
jgi:hypothetical protein